MVLDCIFVAVFPPPLYVRICTVSNLNSQFIHDNLFAEQSLSLHTELSLRQ